VSGVGPGWTLDLVAAALLLNGLLFVIGSSVGITRLPDLFTRAHAASKCDTVGATSILAALALLAPPAAAAKLLALALLVVVTGPTTAHALARSAWRSGRRPWREDERP
jgi:multicomponent Na+:H+ antiporter subunit G